MNQSELINKFTWIHIPSYPILMQCQYWKCILARVEINLRYYYYHSETEHRLLIYMNGSHLPADMFLPSHWESQTRHQVASRTYRTMHWWRFVPSLDLEMLGNQTQYEKKNLETLNFFFFNIWS